MNPPMEEPLLKLLEDLHRSFYVEYLKMQLIGGIITLVLLTLWTMLVWRWVFKPWVLELQRANVGLRSLSSQLASCAEQINQVAVQIHGAASRKEPL